MKSVVFFLFVFAFTCYGMEHCRRELFNTLSDIAATAGEPRVRQIVDETRKRAESEETSEELREINERVTNAVCYGLGERNWNRIHAFSKTFEEQLNKERDLVDLNPAVYPPSEDPACAASLFTQVDTATFFPPFSGGYAIYVATISPDSGFGGASSSACENPDTTTAPSGNETVVPPDPVFDQCPTIAMTGVLDGRCNANFVANAKISKHAFDFATIAIASTCAFFNGLDVPFGKPQAIPCAIYGVLGLVSPLLEFFINACDVQDDVLNAARIDATFTNTETLINQVDCFRSRFEDLMNNKIEHKRVHLDMFKLGQKQKTVSYLFRSTENGVPVDIDLQTVKFIQVASGQVPVVNDVDIAQHVSLTPVGSEVGLYTLAFDYSTYSSNFKPSDILVVEVINQRDPSFDHYGIVSVQDNNVSQ